MLQSCSHVLHHYLNILVFFLFLSQRLELQTSWVIEWSNYWATGKLILVNLLSLAPNSNWHLLGSNFIPGPGLCLLYCGPSQKSSKVDMLIHILQMKKPSSTNLNTFNNLFILNILSWRIKIKIQICLVVKFMFLSLSHTSQWYNNSCNKSCELDLWLACVCHSEPGVLR